MGVLNGDPTVLLLLMALNGEFKKDRPCFGVGWRFPQGIETIYKYYAQLPLEGRNRRCSAAAMARPRRHRRTMKVFKKCFYNVNIVQIMRNSGGQIISHFFPKLINYVGRY